MPTDSLTTRVTDYIFDYIRRNRLSTGEPLPSELKTSTELNVSRGIVREAFRSLELAGILAKSNGRSPRVGVLDGAFLTNLMVHALSTRQLSVMQVLEVRESLEVYAVQFASNRRTNTHVEGLHAAAEGMLAAVSDRDMFVHHDLAFHALIFSATGNPLFEMYCGAMHGSMYETMQLGFLQRTGSQEVAKVAGLHKQIAHAIDRGAALEAVELMKQHFDDTRHAFGRIEMQ